MSESARDVSTQTDLKKLKREADGSFDRAPSPFRDTIQEGSKYEPEKGRYHLYVSYGCPWASRTLIVRKLKGLEDIISVSFVSPRMDSNGWPFACVDPFPGAEDDPIYNAKHLKDVYLKVEPQYQGRFTVPVLFDKKTQSIVNNESSEIIRIFNSAFNGLLPEKHASVNLYPKALQNEIDEVNEWVYNDLNNGVYRTGFASTQSAYEKAYHAVFSALDRVEDIIAAQHSRGSSFLISDHLNEADVRLYVTIIRFDVAYYGLFKCNKRDIRHGYPAIHRWLRNLYWNYPAFKDTTNFEHIKTGYSTVVIVNPNRIAPLGPSPHILPLDGATEA